MEDVNKALLLAMTSLLVGMTSAASYLENGEEPKLFCYYSSFAQNRRGIGKFQPSDIDTGLCTHVIFAFADLVKGSFLKPSSWNDIPNGKDEGLYARTTALKKKNPKLKILLALGGWKVGSEPFIPMIKDVRKRRLFVRNAVRYLRKHGFDGLDMDWEFPGTRGSSADDKYKFTAVMRELRTAFERESRQTGRDRLLLTMAAAGGSYFIGLAYEPEKIVQFVDYILLMTYNYHGSWNDFTGHHSGLFPRADESGGEKEWNQAWTIDYWLNKAGASKDKIVVGIATYGMTFTLADPKDHGLKAAAIGGGSPGRFTGESGILSYYEICQKLGSGWNSVWIDEQKVPYAYSGSQWVGYDNIDSISYKANYIRQKKLAGAFIWSVEMDDFKGTCGHGKYPLLNTIATILRRPATHTQPSNTIATDYSSTRELGAHGVVPSGLPVSRHGLIKQGDDYDYSYTDMGDYGAALDTSAVDTAGQYESNFIGYDDSVTDDSLSDTNQKAPQSYSYGGGYGNDFDDEGYLSNQNPSDLYDNTFQTNEAPPTQSYIPRRHKQRDAGRDKVLETGHSLVSNPVVGSAHNKFQNRRRHKPQPRSRPVSSANENVDRVDELNIDTRKFTGDQMLMSEPSYQAPASATTNSRISTRTNRRHNSRTSPEHSVELAKTPAGLSRSSSQDRSVHSTDHRRTASNPSTRLSSSTRDVARYRGDDRTSYAGMSHGYQSPVNGRESHISRKPQGNDQYAQTVPNHHSPINQPSLPRGNQLAIRRHSSGNQAVLSRHSMSNQHATTRHSPKNQPSLNRHSSATQHAVSNRHSPVESQDTVYGQAMLPRDKEQLRSFLRNVDDSYLTRLLSGPLQDNIVGLESQGHTDQYTENEFVNAKYPDVNHNPYKSDNYQDTEPELSRRRQYFKEGTYDGADQVLEPTVPSETDYQKQAIATDKYSYQSNVPAQSSGPEKTKIVQSWQYYTPGITCKAPGLYAHPSSCKQYYICVRHSTRWYKFHLTCPKGLGFKPSRAVCDIVPTCHDN